MLLTLLLALAAADPAPPPAAPSQVGHDVSPVVVMPALKTAPTPDAAVTIGSSDRVGGQAVSIWPAGAREAGIGGKVTLSCKVDIHGLAEWCRVAYEAPPGHGFGKAALALRPNLKIAPHQGPAGPEDAVMNIAVDFSPSESTSNLHDVLTAARDVPVEGGDSHTNPGGHEVNARNLVVYDNPIAMRRVTIADTRAWAEAPGFDELAAAYPALGGGVEGYAVAHCHLEQTGALGRCTVAKELPAGHGFGKAAVALAARFRAPAAAMVAAPRGASVEVDVPIRFPAPGALRDTTVRAPVWLPGADPETALRIFPAAAARRGGVPGAVVLCHVGPDGALAGCAVELTSPDGEDFDAEALKYAARLKMNLWSAEAGPVQGGIIHLAVRLDLAQR